MEVIWSKIAIEQLDAIAEIVIRHIQIFPNILYYAVESDKILIICIMHEKQSPETVSCMIMEFLRKH